MLKDVEIPKYKLTGTRPRPVMERWIPVIELNTLEEFEFAAVPTLHKSQDPWAGRGT
ncbi:hypothetical protein GCM10025859_06430 [Alicyclobacillus fastidiosus]|nr:hypothetical protein GCM10025859_06430 [Alicyclobacillus fastidiosus]